MVWVGVVESGCGQSSLFEPCHFLGCSHSFGHFLVWIVFEVFSIVVVRGDLNQPLIINFYHLIIIEKEKETKLSINYCRGTCLMYSLVVNTSS